MKRLAPHPLLLTTGVIALVMTLASCGFHLRGNRDLPFNTVYIQAPEASSLTPALRRALRGGTNAQVVDDQEKAEATLEIVQELREKQILSLSTAGRVSEYRLDYTVRFRVYHKDRQFLKPTDVTQWRAFSFDASQVIQREGQEELLYRDMRTDAIQQIVRQVSAIKPDA